MATLETAERVVTQLSLDEPATFRQWFAEFDGDASDAQIEADAAAGILNALAEEAVAEFQTGKVTET